MNNRQWRSFDLMQTLLAWANDPELRDSERVQALLRELRDVATVISGGIVAQASAATERRTRGYLVSRALDNLRIKHVKPLSRDGKHILKGLPGIRDDLRLPHKLAPIEQHVDAAKHIRKIIAPHAQAFIARKHPRDFLHQLDDAIRQLEAADAVDRGAGRAKLSLATRDLREAFADARLIIDRLDATIHAQFADDAAILQRWDHECRVPVRRGRPRKARKAAPGAPVVAEQMSSEQMS